MGIINAQLNVITAKSRFQPGSYVWFGQPNQIPDPDNPATLKIPYLDPDLTQPASAIQGLDSDSKFQQTITGFLYGSGLYSIRVMTAADNTGTQLYYIPEVTVTATVNELGTAAYVDTGTGADEVPLNSDLGSSAYLDVATSAQALAGTAGVLPDAAGVHAAFNQYGYGGQNVHNNALNCNNLPAGSRSSWDGPSEATAVSLNLPALGGSPSASRSWHAECFGRNSATRLVQEATEVYGLGTTRGRTFIRVKHDATWYPWREIYTTGNTTVDPNGFIKAASPIASLYSDRAESNGSAELEAMQFERIGTGHYRLTGVPELSRDGWYIETPKDRNGNVYFTLDYVEADGVLDIYTFTPDYSTGRAENGAPVDILAGRFVSLRFAEAEKPEPEETAE